MIVGYNYQTDDSVFENCHEFQHMMGQKVKPDSIVRLASYNIGINDHDSAVQSFIGSMCKAKEVRLLVGYNIYHDKNIEINAALDALIKRHKNLDVRRLQKLHAKIVAIGDQVWTGSLNIISPTLFDLMVKLNPKQALRVVSYFDTLFVRASLVHPMNKTK